MTGVKAERENEIERHHHISMHFWSWRWSQTSCTPTECSCNCWYMPISWDTSQTVTVVLFSAFQSSYMYWPIFTFSISCFFAAQGVWPQDRHSNLQAMGARDDMGRGEETPLHLPFLLMLAGWLTLCCVTLIYIVKYLIWVEMVPI